MTGYMNRTIEDGVICDEHGTGKIEVTASVGEFDGILLTVTTKNDNGAGGVEMVEMDFTAAHRLMTALQDALNILADSE